MVVWRDSPYIMENSDDDHQTQAIQKGFTSEPRFFIDCIVDALILMKSKYLIGRISTLNWYVQCCHLSDIKKYYHIDGNNDIKLDTILWFGPWKGCSLRKIMLEKDDAYLINYMKRHFTLPQEVLNYIDSL